MPGATTQTRGLPLAAISCGVLIALGCSGPGRVPLSPPELPSPPQAPPSFLTGLVAFLPALTPVSGASVSCSGPTSVAGVTDATGLFSFSVLATGSYLCTVTVPSTLQGMESAELEAELVAHTPLQPCAEFTPIGTLQGKVTLAGAPSSDWVEVVTAAGPSARTEADGSFMITGVPVGATTVSISKQGYFSPPVQNVLIPYNGTLTLPPLVLQPQTPGSGQLQLLGQADASGTTVSVVGGTAQATAAASGVFTLALAPGTYALQIQNGAFSDVVPDVEVVDGGPLQQLVNLPDGGSVAQDLPVLPIPRAQRIFDDAANYASASGTEPQLVASPDGAHVLWPDGQSILTLVPVDGSPPAVLTTGTDIVTAQFSPDGSALLFETTPAGDSVDTLQEATIATGALQTITTTGGDFAWSPQGDFAWFNSPLPMNSQAPPEPSINLTSPLGTEQLIQGLEPLSIENGPMTFTSDGSALLYLSGDGTLADALLSTTGRPELEEGPVNVQEWSAASAAHVALVLGFGATLDLWNWDTANITSLGTCMLLSTGAPVSPDATSPSTFGSIGPDGTSVAWLLTSTGNGSMTTAPAFTQNGGMPLLGPAIGQPIAGRFSPNADRILLIADDQTLVSWSVAANEVVAQNLEFNVQSLAPSPDWTQVAFVTIPDSTGTSTVGISPIQGGGSVTVFTGTLSVVNGVLPISWSPDGAHLAFVSGEGTVFIAPAAGGAAVPVLDSAQGTAPVWLDNGHLAAAIREEASPYEYRLGLYVAPVP